MEITRRTLLQGIVLGTLVAGCPALASAPDRYHELIAAQQRCIDLMPAWRQAGNPELSRPRLETMAAIGLDTAIRDVFVVLRTRFGDLAPMAVDMQAARTRVRRLLFNNPTAGMTYAERLDWEDQNPNWYANHPTINTLDEHELRQFEDFIVNIAVLKGLLTVHGVPVSGDSPVHGGEFNHWANTYREAVL